MKRGSAPLATLWMKKEARTTMKQKDKQVKKGSVTLATFWTKKKQEQQNKKDNQ